MYSSGLLSSLEVLHGHLYDYIKSMWRLYGSIWVFDGLLKLGALGLSCYNQTFTLDFLGVPDFWDVGQKWRISSNDVSWLNLWKLHWKILLSWDVCFRTRKQPKIFAQSSLSCCVLTFLPLLILSKAKTYFWLVVGCCCTCFDNSCNSFCLKQCFWARGVVKLVRGRWFPICQLGEGQSWISLLKLPWLVKW